VKPNSLAPTHHGEILSVQNVANCKIFSSQYHPGLVLSDHIHDRACVGFVVEGQCEERLSTRVLDLSQHKLFFRPAGEIHANRAGSNGFRCLIAEVPDAWLDHIRDYAALPSQPCCFQNADLSWLSMRLYQECRLGGLASPLAIEGLMLEIAAGLLRQQRVDPPGSQPYLVKNSKRGSPRSLSRVSSSQHGCSLGRRSPCSLSPRVQEAPRLYRGAVCETAAGRICEPQASRVGLTARGNRPGGRLLESGALLQNLQVCHRDLSGAIPCRLKGR
jgi:quercetin dioxygenase-like cupin family protein